VLCEALPSLLGDRELLKELFTHLISNGIVFRKSHTKQIVHIAARQTHVETTIEVQDNGMGIESKCHSHVFNIFGRLNPQDQFPGDGLGLAMCRRIMELHDGSIRIQSSSSEGTVFSLAFQRIR